MRRARRKSLQHSAHERNKRVTDRKQGRGRREKGSMEKGENGRKGNPFPRSPLSPSCPAITRNGRLVVARRPSPTSTFCGRSLSATVLLSLASERRRLVGRAKPQGLSPGRMAIHLVRPCERCESDRVADRPFALLPEAPDRGG